VDSRWTEEQPEISSWEDSIRVRLFASVLHDGNAFGTIADDIRVLLA
jgi:hypothetical protein